VDLVKDPAWTVPSRDNTRERGSERKREGERKRERERERERGNACGGGLLWSVPELFLLLPIKLIKPVTVMFI
jgi:hypothetical protein